MTGTKKDLKQKISSLWARTKKDLDNVLDETGRLIKKGEEHIKVISEKSKMKLELMNLMLKRENLYYRLGKAIAKMSQSKWSSAKNLQKMNAEIKKLNREINRYK